MIQIKFGLIGKNLKHSFSALYFHNKWANEGINLYNYQLFEIADEEEIKEFLLIHNRYRGFNITIPYKQVILEHLEELTQEAIEIGAVNCIKKLDLVWKGHNTDGPAFLKTLEGFIPSNYSSQALILGTGGSSKAVQWALKKRNISFDIVSRSSKDLNYDNLLTSWNKNWQLIINTTPLGMYPDSNNFPRIPYYCLDSQCYAIDLIYNPKETIFLRNLKERGCKVINGLDMLKIQADLSFDFWMNDI
ncbi:MAG: shikimate dehydrogenase [Saprospiraceae bacterium]